MTGESRRKAVANYLHECVVGFLVGGLLISVLAGLIALVWS